MNTAAVSREEGVFPVAKKFYDMMVWCFVLSKTPEEISEMCDRYFEFVLKHINNTKINLFVDEVDRQLKEGVFVDFSQEQMGAVKKSFDSFREKHPINQKTEDAPFLGIPFSEFEDAYQVTPGLIQWSPGYC